MLPGVSGHADRDGLLRWMRGFAAEPPRQVFVNHGDDDQCTAFVETLKTELGFEAMAPFSGTVYDLLTGEFVRVTEGVPIERRAAAPKRNKFFDALVKAAERLLAAAKSADGRPNRELRKWTERIEALIRDMNG